MAATKSGNTIPHEVTDKLRGEVSALTSFGNTQEQIAAHLGISIDTLQRHYHDELTNSVLRANAQVAKGLFKKATEDEDLTAMMFWLKTRARWRERDSVSDNVENKQLDEDCKKRMQEQDDKNKKPY